MGYERTRRYDREKKMEDQHDQDPGEASASESAGDTDAPAKRTGPGGLFGFFRSGTFWRRLGVGVLILGAGVLIGLGIDRFNDDDRDAYGSGRNEGGVFTFEVQPSGKWFGEGRLSKDGEEFRFTPMPGKGSWWSDEGKGRFGKRELPGRRFGDRDGIYIPYELLEEHLERIAARVDGLIDKVESYLEGGGFGAEGRFGERFFGRAGGFGDRGEPWWNDPDGFLMPGDDDPAKDADPYEDGLQDGWEEGQGGPGSPFGGLGFPFGDLLPGLVGELLPGLELLEDCELDFDELFAMMESLEGLEGEAPEEGEEGLEGLFEEMEDLLEQACGTPADN